MARESFCTLWEAGEVSIVADSLAAMSAWSSLWQLLLLNPWQQLPAPWQALGTLSQLTSLRMILWQVPNNHSDVLGLRGCRALQHLKIQDCVDFIELWLLELHSTVRLSVASACMFASLCWHMAPNCTKCGLSQARKLTFLCVMLLLQAPPGQPPNVWRQLPDAVHNIR